MAGRVLTVLTALSTNALLARLLTPQDLGTYFLAFSIALFGGVVGSLGLNQTAVRFIAESIGLGQYGRVRQAVVLIAIGSIIGATGIAIVFLLLGPFISTRLFNAPALLAIIGVIAGWIAIVSIQNVVSEAFRGLHDIRLAVLFSGLVTGILLTFVLLLMWIFRGQASLMMVTLAAVASGLTSTLLAGWLLRRKMASLPHDGSGGRVRIGELANVAGPLLATSVTLFILTQVDLWIVGAFQPPEEVALYGAAMRMVLLVATPLLILNAVVPPLIAEMYAQGRREELERVIRIMSAISGVPALVVLLAFVFVGGSILELVFGEFYRGAGMVLILLSVGRLVNVWSGACGITLMMTGHQRTMMTITIFSGLFVVGGSIWAVQEYGIIGVAAVAATGMVLHSVVTLLYAKKRTGMWTHADLRLEPFRKAYAEWRT